MVFEIVGSFIAIVLFLFAYTKLKMIREHETYIYYEGVDSAPSFSSHEDGSAEWYKCVLYKSKLKNLHRNPLSF